MLGIFSSTTSLIVGHLTVLPPLNESCLDGNDQGKTKRDKNIGGTFPRDDATGRLNSGKQNYVIY